VSDKFCNLHFHSCYSYLDAVIKIDGLGEHLKRVGAEACAITEHGNLNSAFAFNKELESSGIKSLNGVEFYYVADRHEKGVSEEAKEKLRIKLDVDEDELKKQVRKLGRERYHVVCIAKNNRGWRKMIRAMEIAHSEGFYYKPRIDRELLLDMAGDVIVTSACVGGVIARLIQANAMDEAEQWITDIATDFGEDFYLEIQSNDVSLQVDHNLALATLAKRTGTKVVATNDVHYLNREDAETHDVLLCLLESQYGKKTLITDTNRFQYGTSQLWLKTRSELEETFERLHPDLPRKFWREALDNTVEVAAKCDQQVIEPRPPIMPKVEIPKRHKGKPDWRLWELVREGWSWRGIRGKTKGETGVCDWLRDAEELPLEEVYRLRVRHEMKLITKLGFSRYFLVVYDLVKWCRENGIRPGPGRGSVAGSIVAYLLGMTSVDSIRWGCPFSRFISEDRIDLPDIDQDVPTDKREAVKEYLREKYGRDRVAAICNFTTMKGRMVLRDVARVHDVPYFETDKVASYIGQGGVGDLRSSLDFADVFEEFSECKTYAGKYPEVVKHATLLEGNVRQLGVHAAGVVISDEPLRELIPVQFKRKRGSKEIGEYLTSWDKDQVEAMGLLKLDVLGIDALSYIQRTLDLVKKRKGIDLEPEDLEPDDPEVYENFRAGNTELVWQLNGQSVVRTLMKIAPTEFEHLVATTALIRPGPLYSGVTSDYIKRRHGQRAKGMHKALDPILERTYGLCIYQEDVSKILHDLAGFTWSEADKVRKGVSKKKIELMEVWGPRFVEGAQKVGGLSESDARKIWAGLIEFAQYSFNVGHSTAYSLLSYWTMYLKIKHSLEFMCAALQVESSEDKRRGYMKEAKRLGIAIKAPEVNVSSFGFVIDDSEHSTIRCGMQDIKGLGEKAVQKICDAAPYIDLEDFVQRSGANKTAIVRLAQVGALDKISKKWNPKQVAESIDQITRAKRRKHWDKAWPEVVWAECGDYTEEERAKYHHELLALPPAIHPAIEWQQWVAEQGSNHFTIHPISALEGVLNNPEHNGRNLAFVGVCTRVQWFHEDANDPSTGKKIRRKAVKLSLEDDTDYLMATPTWEQWQVVGDKNIKEKDPFLVIGSRRSEYKLRTSLIINLRVMREEIEKGMRYRYGSPQQFLLSNPLWLYVDALNGQDFFESFSTEVTKYPAAVYVLNLSKRISRAGNPYWIATCMDWWGDIREVMIWRDGILEYGSAIKQGEVLAMHVKTSTKDGRVTLQFDEGLGGRRRRVQHLQKALKITAKKRNGR